MLMKLNMKLNYVLRCKKNKTKNYDDKKLNI